MAYHKSFVGLEPLARLQESSQQNTRVLADGSRSSSRGIAAAAHIFPQGCWTKVLTLTALTLPMT